MNAGSTNGSSTSQLQAARARSALQMLFIGDSLSMPVHWFYRPSDIWRAFPPNGIQELSAAPAQHPSSVMALHSVSGGGRAKRQKNSQPQIVGEVILKGKAQFWNQNQIHYHHGLSAGENTLNTWCAHLLINWLADRSSMAADSLYDVNEWLTHYVEFMTADPPRHPDTYAESYHRGFFANHVAGKPLTQCGAVTSDTPSMGALVTVAPLALALFKKMPLDAVQAICRQHVWATHPDELLLVVVDAYVKLMHLLLTRETDDQQSIVSWFCEAAAVVDGGDISMYFSPRNKLTHDGKILRLVSENKSVVGERYSLACYITDSWPSTCYLAARHYRNSKQALLVNTNLGGENAHRGSVLGTLLGLVSGDTVEEFYSGLARHSDIHADITSWGDGFYS